ncbi:reverse transcriptase [Vairimorpha necatrix]|uniref:Reverse transcriptase n=1 Tax=Vairimorpha necatrix TaxID=6039 RepID=A0AAX4JHN1_9MICR
MLGFDYMKNHNEVVRCIHLLLCIKYGFKKTKKIRGHSVQEIIENDRAEIRVDTRVSTKIKVSHNRPDILVFGKKKKEILIVEVGITNQDRLTIVENEKLRKYDLLANELGLIHKSQTRIVPYVMTWDGGARNPTLPGSIYPVYCDEEDSRVHLFERRRGYDQEDAGEEEVARAVSALANMVTVKEVVSAKGNEAAKLKLENINNSTETKVCGEMNPMSDTGKAVL